MTDNPIQTAAATSPATIQSASEFPKKICSESPNVFLRKSATMGRDYRLPGSWAAPGRCGPRILRVRLAHILHAQFLHLARQRIAAPTQKLGRILLEAVGLAHRGPDQNALDFGHGLVQETPCPRIELALGPVGQ